MTHDHPGDASSRGTLGRLIISALARFADRDMIGDGTTCWTYRALGDRIGRAVTVLRELGLKRGDGITVLTSNRAEPWAILCAANLMGIRYTGAGFQRVQRYGGTLVINGSGKYILDTDTTK